MEGRNESIQDRTASELARLEREEARMKTDCVVSVKDREEREGAVVASASVMSMKMADPSLDAVQSVKMAPVMRSVDLSESVTERAPPMDAEHLVNEVPSVMEREDGEERLAETAAPSPVVNWRSVNVHDVRVADPPDSIETAEFGISTAE